MLVAAAPPALGGPLPSEWTTFVGTSGFDQVTDIARDSSGNIYVTATATSVDPCCADRAWVAKYSASGQKLWERDIGGDERDVVEGIAYRSGVLVAVGSTYDGFSTTAGAWRTQSGGGQDGFAIRLDPADGRILWATLIGGSLSDRTDEVDIDDTGNVYVAGTTHSCDFPVTGSAYQRAHADACGAPADAYVVKLRPDGASAAYATYLGGQGGDIARGIAVSPSSGTLLVGGQTTARDFDVTPGAFDTSHNGGDWDAFVVKLDSAGARLIFGTYIGGPGDDGADAIARDASSHAYLVGQTDAAGFPTTPGAFQTEFVGGDCGHSKAYRECYDGYALKLDSSGSYLRYGTLLAGDKDEWPRDVAVDAAGAAYIAGSTSSPNFPVVDGVRKDADEVSDVLALALAPSGRGLLYATHLNGRDGAGGGTSLVVAPGGGVVLGGYADNETFNTTAGADRRAGAASEGFLAKLGAPTQQLVFAPPGGNEWYVETVLGGREVDAVTQLEVRDTGGAWATLSKQPYGKWGGGYHVEPGHRVEFRATLSNGIVRTSCAYEHPGGGCAEGGDSAFDATFSGVKGNEWWVEARVSANEPLAKVEARVDGGEWKALTLRSWGAWAASFHMPQGSLVQLRATGASGATELSGCYRWTDATPADCSSEPEPAPGLHATFDHKGGNEWWVELKLDANFQPDDVLARDDGGPWVHLDLRSWGHHAASFRIEPGHKVQFMAEVWQDGTLHQLVSCWFTHPEGVTPTGGATCEDTADGSQPPPPPSGFDATFSNVRGNEWWVETNVATTGGTLAGVDARVNGGAWTALAPTSWGSWAKSLHAPSGSTVEFRARATDGATDTSAAYTWPPA